MRSVSMKYYINILFIKSWWVIFFMVINIILYEQGLKNLYKDYFQLYNKLTELQTQKVHAIAHQQSLMRELHSQSDQAWIELTLMKGLGLVPEGQEKVYFKNEETSK